MRENPSTGKKSHGGLDLFACNWLFFPLNKFQHHWTFFCVDPNTLEQRFYCSQHGRLDDKGRKGKLKQLRCHVSKCLHRWIIHQHKLRLGGEHPKVNVTWSGQRDR